MTRKEAIADSPRFRVAQYILESLAPSEPGFVQRAREHRLGPIAFTLGMSLFRQDYLASAGISERRKVALEEIGDAMGGRGIAVIPIKGMSYVGWLYPDPALRPMSDMDLLVESSTHGRAGTLLESLGYRRCTTSTGSRSRLHHATTFQRERQYVDLHRNIVQPLRTSINISELFARAQSQPSTFLRLSLVDSALVHFAHIARSELFVPAVNYLDGAMLLDLLSEIDLQRLASRAHRYRIAHGIRLSIEMTRCVTSAIHNWSPAGLRARSLPGPDELLSRVPARRILQILRKLSLCDDLRGAGGLVAGALIERLTDRVKA